jgi:ribosome biogenesis protein Nip4
MNEVDEFTKKFTTERIEPVIKLQRNFFHAPENLRIVQKNIKKEPFALGTYLGSGKPFHPSTALIDWLNKRTEKYVVVDKKMEWLFLCGRDIFDSSIVKKNANTGTVLVKNELGEVLGYGDFVRDMIKNRLDKGDFLRRERH